MVIKNPNLLFGLFAILGVAALALGGMQIRQSVSTALYAPSNDGELAELLRSGSYAGLVEQDLQALQATDTDGDGLNDFEELYTYNTSPYLEDSDSDGLLDSEEIVQGEDPNCPKGRDCSGSVVDSLIGSDDDLLDLVESLDIPLDAQLEELDVPTEISTEDLNEGQTQKEAILKLESMSASELRNLLLQQGVTNEDLAQFSDEDLKAALKEIISTTE